jgi:dihydrodipicolinate synthase/N-acetylneuraminate lyase
MYEEGNPVGLKALLSILSVCSGEVRLPLVPASKNLFGKIERLQKEIKK